MHFQVLPLDVFVGIAIALVSVRWNVMFQKSLVDEEFLNEFMEDQFITLVTIFAVLFMATGQNVLRAFIGMLIFGIIVLTKSPVILKYLCIVFVIMALIERFQNKGLNRNGLKKVGGNWFTRRNWNF